MTRHPAFIIPLVVFTFAIVLAGISFAGGPRWTGDVAVAEAGVGWIILLVVVIRG